jgi:hypothetical protein
VPLFVVVLAFIGGAVSLSRRIPEYQRRSEPGYVPTDREPAMLPFQARENVVFQVMQLTSAPFLAMATWYIVSPATVAAAAGLAFGTGFASEPLLLMIRGMVEGIRPEGSRIPAPMARDLKGVVLRKADRTPVTGAQVTLTLQGDPEQRVLATDAKGEFVFANVKAGKVTLTAVDADAVSATQDVTIGDRPASVELQL